MTDFKFSAQDGYLWSNGGRKLPKYVLAWMQADGTMEYPWLFDPFFRDSDMFATMKSTAVRKVQGAQRYAAMYPSIWSGSDKSMGGRWTYVKTRGAPTMDVNGKTVNCRANEINALRRLYPNGRDRHAVQTLPAYYTGSNKSNNTSSAWSSFNVNGAEYRKLLEIVQSMEKTAPQKTPDYAGAMKLLGAEIDTLKNRVKALEEELVLVQSGDA